MYLRHKTLTVKKKRGRHRLKRRSDLYSIHDGGHQLGFARQLIVHQRPSDHFAHGAPVGRLLHLKADGVAGGDGFCGNRTLSMPVK
jgi:hypothetical protein